MLRPYLETSLPYPRMEWLCACASTFINLATVLLTIYKFYSPSDMHSCIFSHIWSHAIYSDEVSTNQTTVNKNGGQYGILHMCTVSNQHFNRRSILKTPRGSKTRQQHPAFPGYRVDVKEWPPTVL